MTAHAMHSSTAGLPSSLLIAIVAPLLHRFAGLGRAIRVLANALAKLSSQRAT